jgi:hypothetical protein
MYHCILYVSLYTLCITGILYTYSSVSRTVQLCALMVCGPGMMRDFRSGKAMVRGIQVSLSCVLDTHLCKHDCLNDLL